MMKRIGIIGGSGLERLTIFKDKREIEIPTPYGSPSSSFWVGQSGDTEVYILSRHGRAHEIPPHMVNNRANIEALRILDVEAVIATSACGSLRQEIGKGDIVIPDQLIDFTKHRISTYHDSFKDGILSHISFADPFDHSLRSLIINTAQSLHLDLHQAGTIITIEGPRFSTRAESRMYRTLGADIVNMSTAPEAALAREAHLSYAIIALSTDYDAWKEDEEAVEWNEVLRVFKENISKLDSLLNAIIKAQVV